MVLELADGLAQRGAPASNDSVSLGSDLAWGVEAISVEIGRTKRQTFHLLENGKLPATKIGGRWVVSKSGLRQFFAKQLAGEVA